MSSVFIPVLSHLFFLYVLANVFGSTDIYSGNFKLEGIFTNTNLKDLQTTYFNSGLIINEALLIADCKSLGNETTCQCMPGKIWSGKVCKDHPRCCNQPKCGLNVSHYDQLCIPEFSGSTIVTGEFMIEDNSTFVADPQDLLYIHLYLTEPIGKINESVLVAECESSRDDTRCWCRTEHIWSNTVCENHSHCCNQLECASDVSGYTPLCLPKVNVELTGQIRFNPPSNLSGDTELGKMLENSFQKMSGYNKSKAKMSSDKLSAEFNVTLHAVFKTAQLTKLIEELQVSLTATINVETEGLVEMSIQSEREPYELSCKIKEEMSNYRWSLSKKNKEEIVENGTQATIGCDKSSNTVTKLWLNKAEKFWTGLYTCRFASNFISHKASGEFQIPLPPDIIMESNPQTADCSGTTSKQDINVSCTIQSDDSNITSLNFINVNPVGTLIEEALQRMVYRANIICKDAPDSLNATCKINYSRDKMISQNLTVPIIKPTDVFCEEDGEWPKTKENTNATQSCIEGRTGKKYRPCKKKGVWGPVLDYCVRKEIKDLQSFAKSLDEGYGATPERASKVFSDLKNISNPMYDTTLGDAEALINILDLMRSASYNISLADDTVMANFMDSANNILSVQWSNESDILERLSTIYLKATEGLLKNIKVNSSLEVNSTNIQFLVCQNECVRHIFDVELSPYTSAQQSKVMGLKNLTQRLPNVYANTEICSIAVSLALENVSNDKKHLSSEITLTFPLNQTRQRNHRIYCVYWQTSEKKWERESKCKWKSGKDNYAECVCELTKTKRVMTFSTLVSKVPIELPYLKEIAYVGHGLSICSLVIFMFIEGLVWTAVTKTNLSHSRHTALVNITVFLLLANCSLLASTVIEDLREPWCGVLAVAMHFFYLAMFFWMLCLSMMLLHHLIFIFQHLGKKVFLILSFFIGYICPVAVVAVAYIYYEPRKSYHDPKTCWLKYEGEMKGSIHTFLIPVGVIVLMNLFCMIVVLMTVLRPKVSEAKGDSKETIKGLLKAIIILTPVFGTTWLLGFFVFIMDLTDGFIPVLINYAFTITNSLQGFFILLVGWLGEKKVQNEVSKRFGYLKPKTSESAQNLTPSTQTN